MNFRLPPDPVILFLDYNFGTKMVPKVLSESGIPFELHTNHLPPNAPDEDWIALCSDRNWIAITKDNELRRNPIATHAIKASHARVFTLTAKNLTGDQNGNLIVKYYNKLVNYCARTERPFLATLSAQGRIQKVTLR